MHQHPRSPAVPSSAPKMPAKSSAARDDLKDSDSVPPSPTTDGRSHPAEGLGIDGAADQASKSSARDSGPPGKEAMTKLNQIISNYHTKAALIILHSRVELPPAYLKNSDTPKVNRWFNVELEDTDVLREQLWTWRTCDAATNRPPPLIIETYLDCTGLTNNQSLVILDDNGKRWDVQDSIAGSRGAGSHTYHPNADDVILERWRIELGEATSKPTAELGSILPTVYKKSIVLFRSLFTYSKFLPAWKFSRNIKVRWSPALQVKYRVLDPSTAARSDRERFKTSRDHLALPLYEGSVRTVDTYNFGTTESPAGPFSVNVTYRTNCDFRIDDSEALLSSRFMGADDDIFRPSLPSEDVSRLNPEIGSVPVGRRTVEYPDRSRAYGSLSTFHQIGPTGGTSPISALRAARDSGIGSSSPSDAHSRRLLPPARIAPPTGRAAQIASESLSSSPRRPSISFQAFKAPPLSASPALVDTPLGVSPRTTSARLSGTSAESRVMPPPSSAASARKPAGLASEQAISSSTSASPKPAPISRYSSSFSHRRGRHSTGGVAKTEDDSSGKVSAASSNVQPGSGLLAELTGTSAESFHADDEKISEFLKELDSGKNLMNTSSSTSTHLGQRKPTSASVALGRFQRMRDSNAALSDSMSSSMHLHRSSTSSSKQLSGVPPMISGTSISTASSPGKPISPHTPHTPAIRSRLSSNSVADEISTEHDRRGPHLEHDSPLEENPSLENTQPRASTAGAIDIPTSPRVFSPAYRRSSSAAQHRRPHSGDDEEIFNLVIRSMSMGAETPGPLQQRNPDPEAPTGRRRPSEDQDQDQDQDQSTTTSGTATRGQTITGPSAASSSSNLYQPRFASSRGRGFSGGHSLSSASSSLARGATIPPHLVERDDHDGNASGSNSGNSTTEIRRGSLQRPGVNRAPPSQAVFEDDEPLLFAMSDFGASRRSLEENRHGNHGADSSGSSRRGSGRRGAGLSGGW